MSEKQGVVCGGLGLQGFQQSLVDVGLETSFDPTDGDLRLYMDQVFKSVMTKQTPQARAGLQGLLGALVGQDIVDLQVIDSEPPVDSIFEKRSRFDVVVTFNNLTGLNTKQTPCTSINTYRHPQN